MPTTRAALVAVALACLGIGIALAVRSRDEAHLDRARADVLAGRHVQALAELEGLDGEARLRASALRGYALLGTGRPARARTALQVAARRAPNDWTLQRDYAIVLLALGERAKAQARMRRARGLNPRLVLPPGFVAAR